MYRMPRIIPGNRAPINRSPTDKLSWSAIITSMILGGIRIPRVPEAQTVPTAKGLAYPCLSMAGRDKSPRSTTDAPIIPVAAASRMPMRVTLMASPPLTLPNRSCMANIIFSAIPERSSISPMKMNRGRAISIQLYMTL